ncbi:MAG TPA: MFS transporter [Methylomirabilota bacterium]|nr:MFS transporter [Methylomirabilota bacterium]
MTLPPRAEPDFRRLAIFFAAVYFVQGFAEPKAGIAAQPIFFLLKEELRFGPAEIATFFAITGIAWAVKPLYGLTSDLVPLFGYRRRSYLLITTAMAALGWLVLGLLPGYPYRLTLAILVLTGLGLAFTDVLCDAVMVEEGKPRGLTGRFQSVQWSAIYAASLIAGIGGGYLSEYVPYSWTFLLVAVFPALSFAASAHAVHEPRTRFDRATVQETLAALRRGIRSGPLWRAAAFLLLWNFSPSFGVPLQVYMVDVLGISKIQLGWLATIGSAASMAGAIVFGRYLSGYPLRPLLNVAIAIGVATTLAYYGLVGWWSAVALSAGVGFITMVAFLATMDLAARAVPTHAEGTFFAALMSVNNIGTSGSEWIGGQLYDLVGLNWLIAISAAATAACWLLVPWIRVEPLAAPAPSPRPGERAG